MSTGAESWVRALSAISGLAEDGRTLAGRLPELAERFGAQPALLSVSERLTYGELAKRANQYGRWALEQGLRPGEVVCLLMPNAVDYPAIWLGISGVGGVVALLNTGLRDAALAHAIGTVAARHVVAHPSFAPALDLVRPRLPSDIGWWLLGADLDGWRRLDAATLEDGPVAAERAPRLTDRALHIYTSGTTGLPKAVNITHARVLEWSFWFAGMMNIGPDDRMYNCLPMYHSIGGVVAVGALLARGGSVLVRPGFSASRFWDEVADGGCTVFQYIGELCRYLVNAPPHPRERQHTLRLACGNGLQAEVWTRFAQRFAIPQILEYYAATEGSVSLYNTEQRPGAIGRIPPYLAHRFPLALIRSDPETGVPLRDDAGRCQRCLPDEVGEAIGPVPDGGLYTDAEASSAKVLRDVFAPGDAWFRTGDLMRRDRAGFFSFVDRIGDTFRWKGKTFPPPKWRMRSAPIRASPKPSYTASPCPGRKGGREWRRWWLTQASVPKTCMPILLRGCPTTRIPLFLRLRAALAATGTFKPVKAALQRDGFDPDAISDPLLVLDRAGGGYAPLDAARFERIAAGEARL